MDETVGFDRPLFKKLAHNDTGAAVGHQAGILIPQEMDQYFPDLSGKLSGSGATHEDITAMLFVGDTPKGVVSTSYQYQTWGGTRSPERRITKNLTALRNEAKADDYVVIERSVSDPWLYRLTLLKAGTAAYVEHQSRVGRRKWGPVDVTDRPVTEAAVSKAEKEQAEHETKPLELFDNAAAKTETRTMKVARSRAFQKRVATIYNFCCAVCGNGLSNPLGGSEVEAAHIIPRGLKGADDARNGLALCRSHHWAFDRGLFGVQTGKILIPAKVSAVTLNSHLTGFAGKTLRPPTNPALTPSPAALEWHMKNIVSFHL